MLCLTLLWPTLFYLLPAARGGGTFAVSTLWNLLDNSDFENRNGWEPVGPIDFTYSKKAHKSGRQSAKVSIPKGEKSFKGGVTQRINVTAVRESALVVEAWVYANKSAFPLPKDDRDFSLQIWVQTKNQKKWEYERAPFKPRPNTWTAVSITLPLQEPLQHLRVECSYTNKVGTVYFDDITAYIGEAPATSIIQPSFMPTNLLESVSESSIRVPLTNTSLLPHTSVLGITKSPEVEKVNSTIESNNVLQFLTVGMGATSVAEPPVLPSSGEYSESSKLSHTITMQATGELQATSNDAVPRITATTVQSGPGGLVNVPGETMAELDGTHEFEEKNAQQDQLKNDDNEESNDSNSSTESGYVVMGVLICIALISSAGLIALIRRRRSRSTDDHLTMDEVLEKQEAMARNQSETQEQTAFLLDRMALWAAQLSTNDLRKNTAGGKNSAIGPRLPCDDVQMTYPQWAHSDGENQQGAYNHGEQYYIPVTEFVQPPQRRRERFYGNQATYGEGENHGRLSPTSSKLLDL